MDKNINGELLEALKLIRKTCESNNYCRTCPLRRSDPHYLCEVIKTRPDKWELFDDLRDCTRLFK